MFSTQTENTLATHLPLESGLPGMAVLPAEVYRELVYAARQWDAMRSGPVHGGSFAMPAIYKPRLTSVGCGDGNTFAVG
jgi:hypothetical protein